LLKLSEELAAIESAREEAKAKNEPRDPKKEYKKVCRACLKPNTLTVDFCTGCEFNLRFILNFV
jgi:hypothetical protein